MKKRVFISVMVFLQVLVAWGQLSVGSFTRMENDLTARIDAPKRDQNGDVCAIIKVVTNQTDFVWEPDALGIVAAEKKTGEYWIYVPHSAKRLTIKHPQLGILRNYTYPVPIEKATVYVMELLTARVITTVVQEATATQWLIINSTPSGADVYINDQPVSKTPFQGEYPLGKYTWRLQKELYINEAGVVELTQADKAIVQADLKPNFGNLIVLTEPEFEASVSLDGYPQNKKTPAMLEFIPVGEHEIRVTHPKYETTSKKVMLRPGFTDTITIKMNAIYGTVTITTDPAADILINGQLKGNGSYSENLMPGFYTFEAKLDRHNSAIERRTIVSGQTADISLSPNPRLGGLKVVTTPPLARILINGEDKGTTPITIQNLLIGDYQIEMIADGVGSLKKTVTVSEGNITAIQETITKNSADMQKVNDAYTNYANQNFGGTVTTPVSELSTVEITTLANADIYINGKQTATGSWKGTLKPGVYDFEARAPNYKGTSERKILVAGSNTKVNLNLTPVEGTVRITSIPSGATLLINDVEVGKTPYVSVLQPGKATVTLKAGSRYLDLFQVIEVGTSNNEFEFTLFEKGKEIRITSVPLGAEVSINGNFVGNTPYTSTFDYGNYEVELKSKGFKTVTEKLNVSTSTSENQSYTLESTKRKHSLKSFITASYQTSQFINESFSTAFAQGDIVPEFGGVAGFNINAYPVRIDVNGFMEKFNTPNVTVSGQANVAWVYHEGIEAAMSFYLLHLGRFMYFYAGGGYHFSQLRMDFDESVSSSIEKTYTFDTSGFLVKGGVLLNLKALTIFGEFNFVPATKEHNNYPVNAAYSQLRVGIGF